jgi:hypothetical protein
MDTSTIEKRNTEFKDALSKDVESLIRLYEKDSSTAGRPGDWLEAIARSAVVLTAANLESFLEDVVCSGLRLLSQEQLAAQHYPENIRVWVFQSEASRQNISLKDARDIVELTQKLWAPFRPIETDELKLDAIRERFANPIPANVNWLMGLLDYSNYAEGVSVTVQGETVNAQSGLGELARRRNEIAHGNTEQKPEIDDVDRLRKFVKLFGNRVTKDIVSTVKSSLDKG